MTRQQIEGWRHSGQEKGCLLRNNHRQYLKVARQIACFCLVAANTGNNPAFSVTVAPQPPLQKQVTVKSACMEQNLETLITQLLRDLPSYSNRATQRARRLSRKSDIFGYILIAGRPEFQPLPLNFAGSNIDEKNSITSDVKQVFFSTLERQYINKTVVELEEFHWLFLTKTDEGWRFVVMFTQTGGYPKQQPPTPPRDSSNSAIAQGLKTWLRDCQADSVRVL